MRPRSPSGLAVPAGIVTHTGVAGLTLGGGIGWIQRKYGLTIDQLLSVQMVTAEGELVRASENENADLFWGVRGEAATSGSSPSSSSAAVPLSPTVMAGPVFWLMEEAEKVLHFYRDWIADCPDELMTIVMQRRAPALPVVPAGLVGKPVVGVAACYAGPVEEGEKILRPLKRSGHPSSTCVSPSRSSPIKVPSTLHSLAAPGTTSAPVTSPN